MAERSRSESWHSRRPDAAAFNVNNRGEIAGFGVLPNGDGQAFLLAPCGDKHPGIEDCDYSTMEANTTASVEPAIHATPGRELPIGLWRCNRFHLPRPVIGQTNLARLNGEGGIPFFTR